MDSNKKRLWAEISLENLIYNMQTIRASLPENVKYLGVVKADAYGHGAVAAARALEKGGADYLAVACLDEAAELRQHNITLPILILGPTPSQYTPQLLHYDLTQAVGSLESAEALSRAAAAARGRLRIHIKADTGMSRTGFLLWDGARMDAAADEIAAACRLPGLVTEGIFTHFAVSDIPGNQHCENSTRRQLRLFLDLIEALETRGIRFALRHCANSGGVLYYPKETALDMVRPGILLYGYGDDQKKLELRPCIRLVTRIAAVQTYPAGTPIGYGGTYVTQRETRLGVIPIGYADGLHRCLSNRCAFFTAGGFAPQRGRICMDLCMIDLTELPDAQLGSEVELFGPNAPLEALAEAAGTITYELLCAVSKRVPRIYIS